MNCPHCQTPLTPEHNKHIHNERVCDTCYYNQLSDLIETNPPFNPMLRPSIKTTLNNYLALYPEPWQKREAIKQIITHLNTQLQNAFYPETTPKTLTLNSKVEIIGPNVKGSNERLGQKWQIDRLDNEYFGFPPINGSPVHRLTCGEPCMYPATSLKLITG